MMNESYNDLDLLKYGRFVEPQVEDLETLTEEDEEETTLDKKKQSVMVKRNT
jgi:hypothetical protein